MKSVGSARAAWLVTFMRNILARRIRRRRIAGRIKACFDGIDLTRHEFMVGGSKMRTEEGDAQFYRAAEVDRAIAAINALMRDLRNEAPERHAQRRGL